MLFFKSFFKTSCLLNLLGMIIAFAALYIILAQVFFELGYNKRQIDDVDKIYVLTWKDYGGKYNAYLNRAVPSAVMAGSPVVVAGGAASLLNKDNGEQSVYLGEVGDHEALKCVVCDFTLGALNVFNFNAAQGVMEELSQPGTIAISKSASKRTGINIGDRVRIKSPDSEIKSVVAIFNDFPDNSDLGDIEFVECYHYETFELNDWRNRKYIHFVKLNSRSNAAIFEEQALVKIKAMIDSELGNTLAREKINNAVDKFSIHLIPFTSIYFGKELSKPIGKVGNRVTTYALLVISFLIVLITLINFINFFLAQIPLRIRSVNIKKIMGCQRWKLIGSFIKEAAILVFLSVIFAMIVVMSFKSSYLSALISCPLGFDNNQLVILVTIVIALLLTVIAGLYPAMYITSFSPAFALKGALGVNKTGKKLRYSLLILQFVISISLIICTLFIKVQNSYMMNYDMGFNKRQLLVSLIPTSITKTKKEDFSNKLLSSSMIKDIAWSSGALVNTSRMIWHDDLNGTEMHYDVCPVSYNFLNFMGINITEGRDFNKSDEQSKDGVFIFNEKAKGKYGLKLEDKLFGHRTRTNIAGFCEDFQFKPLQYGVEPFAFYVFGIHEGLMLNNLYVRMIENTDISRIMNLIQQTAVELDPNLSKSEIGVKLFDEDLGSQYQKEQRLSTMIDIFALMAIIISLIGVCGLVIFESQYRIKEIAIRRVNGSSIAEILQMFNTTYIGILSICFIVAAPISYFIVDHYFLSFAYRSPMHWWVFLIALIAVFAITILVVTVSSMKAAKVNPAMLLKRE